MKTLLHRCDASSDLPLQIWRNQILKITSKWKQQGGQVRYNHLRGQAILTESLQIRPNLP